MVSNMFFMQTLLSWGIVGAMFGAAFGCWKNESSGKKGFSFDGCVVSLVMFLAIILVAFSSLPSLIVSGTMIVGFGVGMISMTSSLKILEASSLRLRSSFANLVVCKRCFTVSIYFFPRNKVLGVA